MNSIKTFEYNFKRAVGVGLFARDEGGGGDNTPPAPKTFTQAEVDALTAGLRTKNDELLGKNKTYKEQVQKFEGLDVDSLKALKDKLDKDQDMKDIAEGRVMDVLGRHTERMQQQHERDLQAERDKVAAAHQRADKYKQAVLDNQIRAAATGLHKGAVEDALLHARGIFQLDDNGNAVQIQDGNVILGKDGKTPFGPGEWFEQMKETKAHWFPSETTGSGSGDARQAGGTGKSIKRSDFNALPPAKQREVATTPGIQIID